MKKTVEDFLKENKGGFQVENTKFEPDKPKTTGGLFVASAT
jgi:hypothetical protein